MFHTYQAQYILGICLSSWGYVNVLQNYLQDFTIIGVHIFHKPGLVLRDPELIKRVMIQDFSSFSTR